MKIAVIGYSCSGKTLLSGVLAKLYPDYTVIHADDYKPFDFEVAMDPLINDVIKSDKVICEGVMAARLLRKGAQLNRLFFDVVIECQTDEKTQMSRYTTERDASKWHYIKAQNKSIDTIFGEYKALITSMNKQPVFLQYKT